jgi:hypothetical protein
MKILINNKEKKVINMKTKYLIIILLIGFAICSANATPGATSDRDLAAPGAGISTGGAYSNYGIAGEPAVGLQSYNGNEKQNYFGYFYGLVFGIVINTNSIVISPTNPTQAICYCAITDDGGYMISSRGICRNTTGNPVLTDNPVTCGSGNGLYSGTLTGLSAGTTYYVRAYATTSTGATVYGNQLTYTAIPTLGEWGLIAFAGLVAVIGGVVVWKRFV